MRYNLAQMIARAMAKTTVVDTNTGKVVPVSNSDKALIDRLAAEFSDELNNLGVRVANLERNADMVKWNGKVEYTYTSTRYEGDTYQDYARDENGNFQLDNEGRRIITKNKRAKSRVNQNDVLYRLEPSAEINKHWHINARLDGHVDMNKDTGSTVDLKRVFAVGKYKDVNLKLGRQELYTNEHGLVFDDNFSGANVQFGNKFKVGLLAGRINNDTFATAGSEDGKIRSDGTREMAVGNNVNHIVPVTDSDGNLLGYNYPSSTQFANKIDNTDNSQGTYSIADVDDPATLLGINLQYDTQKGLFGGAGYYHLSSKAFGAADAYSDVRNAGTGYTHHGYSKDGRLATNEDGSLKTDANGNYITTGYSDEANIYSFNLGYKIGKGSLWGSYAQNSEADWEDKAYQAQFDYGNYQNASKKGQWSMYAAYRKLGANTSLLGTYDGIARGVKGWEVGASYAIMKNVGLRAIYANGETITGGQDYEKLFGRVEFFW